MFNKKPQPFSHSYSEIPETRLFLDAQSERVQNKFDITGNPVVSTLSEAVEDNKTDVDHFIYITNQDQRYGEEGVLRTVLNTVRKNFLDAQREHTFYDPLDGDSLVGYYLDLDTISGSQKQQFYTLIENYYKYLTETNGIKVEKKIGRHVLVTMKEHGRRALRTDEVSIPIKTGFQKG